MMREGRSCCPWPGGIDGCHDADADRSGGQGVRAAHLTSPRRPTPMQILLPTAALSLALTGAALAQQGGPISIVEIKAQVFLERSGRWSDDLAATKTDLRNLPLPTSALGEPGDAVLVTLVFEGPKNTQSSRALARDMATLNVKQTKGGESRQLLYRALGSFHFNDAGKAHKAFLIDEATCAPLEIEVKIGRSRKAQKLDFACDEVKRVAGDDAKDAKGRQAGEGRAQRR